jgi:hypothetical protein
MNAESGKNKILSDNNVGTVPSIRSRIEGFLEIALSSKSLPEKAPKQYGQIDKYLVGTIVRAQVSKGFVKIYGKTYEKDVKTLRAQINTYFTEGFGFSQAEWEEWELLFILLVCCTHGKEKAKSVNMKRKKRAQREEDIRELIQGLKKKQPHLSLDLDKVFGNPCLVSLYWFF